MSSLADVIIGNPDETARVPQLRQGLVTSTSPLLVLVGAATTAQACRALISYVPTLGDTVSVLVIAGDRLVLGKANAAGGTGGGGVDPTQFVRKTGDTMTGALSMNAAAGTEQISVNGAASYMAWWSGGTRLGYLQGNTTGLFLASDVGALSLNAATTVDVHKPLNMIGNNGVQWGSWGGGWYMSDASWIRSLGSKGVWTGGGWIGTDGGVTIGQGGGTSASYKLFVNGRGYTTGGFDSDGNIRGITNNQDWGSAGVLTMARPGGDRGVMSTHGVSVAHVWGSVNGQGWFFVWNSAGTAYADCIANQWYANSQRRNKQDVEPFPAPAPASVGAVGHRLAAVDRLRRIEVVTYRRRREHALLDVIDDGSSVEHFCDETDLCDGTAVSPCWRVRDWMQPVLGVVVEQAVEHLPEMVGLDHVTGEPLGVNPMAGVAALIAAVQELDERLDRLENT